jgi:hypothetical protein
MTRWVGGRRLFEEGQGLLTKLPLLILDAELDQGFGVSRFVRPAPVEVADRILSSKNSQNPSMELLGWRGISGDPVTDCPVSIEEQNKRRAPNIELLEELFAGDLAPRHAKEDKILLQELGFFGIVINLLDQQVAVSSADFREEVDEEELTRGFRRGQCLFERTRSPSQARCEGHEPG